VQAGALLALFFASNINQTFEELEVKQSIMIHRVYGDTPCDTPNQKSKQTSVRKISNFTVDRDHSYKN